MSESMLTTVMGRVSIHTDRLVILPSTVIPLKRQRLAK